MWTVILMVDMLTYLLAWQYYPLCLPGWQYAASLNCVGHGGDHNTMFDSMLLTYSTCRLTGRQVISMADKLCGDSHAHEHSAEWCTRYSMCTHRKMLQ